jgi:hypothetical protein
MNCCDDITAVELCEVRLVARKWSFEIEAGVADLRRRIRGRTEGAGICLPG